MKGITYLLTEMLAIAVLIFIIGSLVVYEQTAVTIGPIKLNLSYELIEQPDKEVPSD